MVLAEIWSSNLNVTLLSITLRVLVVDMPRQEKLICDGMLAEKANSVILKMLKGGKSMWQRISDAMPDTNVDVLLYLKSKEFYIGQWNSRSQIFLFKEFFVPKKDVLAWCPLPPLDLERRE